MLQLVRGATQPNVHEALVLVELNNALERTSHVRRHAAVPHSHASAEEVAAQDLKNYLKKWMSGECRKTQFNIHPLPGTAA